MYPYNEYMILLIDSLYSFFSVSFSKYFLSTGPTMKWRAEATLTRPAMVYMVLLYRKGLGSIVPGEINN